MSITRIEGDTHAADGELYVCARILGEIWEGDYYNIRKFTVCLKERTSEKRPYKAAIKLDIPRYFVRKGVKYELEDGSMSDGTVLTCSADAHVIQRKLQNKKYWAWLELPA